MPILASCVPWHIALWIDKMPEEWRIDCSFRFQGACLVSFIYFTPLSHAGQKLFSSLSINKSIPVETRDASIAYPLGSSHILLSSSFLYLMAPPDHMIKYWKPLTFLPFTKFQQERVSIIKPESWHLSKKVGIYRCQLIGNISFRRSFIRDMFVIHSPVNLCSRDQLNFLIQFYTNSQNNWIW